MIVYASYQEDLNRMRDTQTGRFVSFADAVDAKGEVE